MTEGLSRCRDELIEAFETLLRESIQKEGVADLIRDFEVSFGEISFPQLGDSSIAYRIAIDLRALGLPLEFTGDIIGIRVGRMVGGLTYFVVGRLDIEEEQGLAEIVVDKLKKANASLSD